MIEESRLRIVECKFEHGYESSDLISLSVANVGLFETQITNQLHSEVLLREE